MQRVTDIIQFLSPYRDQGLLLGIGLLFLGWVGSRYQVWLPWFRQHPVFTDLLMIWGSTLFILTPLTQFGAPGGHDLYFHTSRVAELNWLFRDGYYYGRWTPDFNHGFGYPLLNFYPPLIYYVAQIFRALGISVLGSLNWVIATGVWLSALCMYVFGKDFWGRTGGVVCAVAYVYIPYRMVNLYVRGAIPEFYAMTFMPVIFWSVYQLVCTRRYRYLVIGGISYGFIIMSHNVTAVFFTFCLIGYSLFLLFEERRAGSIYGTLLRQSGMVILTAVLGIGLSAVYWLPAMIEKQFVQISGLYTDYHDVAVHFVYFLQFFSRFWGYGGSGAGPRDGMSFQLGIEHLLLVAVTVAVVFVLRRTYPRQRDHVIFYVALSVILVFAMLSPSLVIWRTLPLIQFISFPWRLLSLTAFALSFLCGGIGLINFDQRWAFGNRIVQGIVIGWLLVLTVGYCRPGGLLPLPDDQYSRAKLQGSSGAAMNGEYLPIWADKSPQKVGIQIQGGEMQIRDGQATLTQVSADMLSAQFRVDAATPTVVLIGTLYFPGWNAYLDGQPYALGQEPKTGLITLNIPQGKHLVTLHFEETLVRKIGQYISLSMVSLLIIFGGYTLLKRWIGGYENSAP